MIESRITREQLIVKSADASYACLQEALKASDAEDRFRLLKLAALNHPGGCSFRGDVFYVAEYDEGRSNAKTFENSVIVPVKLNNGQSIKHLNYDYQIFSDASVTERGHIINGDVLYSDLVQCSAPFWHMGNAHYWFYVSRSFSAFDPETRCCLLEPPTDNIDEKAFVFATANSSVNFGHFVHDFLLQVPIYRKIKAERGDMLCLFAERFRYPMQWLIFDDLFREEIEKGKVLFEKIEGKYRTIFMPHSQFSPLDGINYAAVGEVRDYMRDLAARKGSSKIYREYIYVSRLDGTSDAYGRMRHYAELEMVFSDCGFQILTISDLSLEDVLSAFQHAKIVAGIHGSGLLNIMFSDQQDSLLIEIQTEKDSWNSIERVIKSAGLRHVRGSIDMTKSDIYDIIGLGND